MTRTRRGVLKQCSPKKFRSTVTNDFSTSSSLISRPLRNLSNQKFRKHAAKKGRQKRPVRFSHRIVCLSSLQIHPSSDRPEPTDRSAPLSSDASSRNGRSNRAQRLRAGSGNRPAPGQRSGGARRPAASKHTPVAPARLTLHQKT